VGLKSGFKGRAVASPPFFSHQPVAPRTTAQNTAQAVLGAGNSPQMIFTHYRRLLTEKAAKEWCAINQKTEMLKAENRGRKVGGQRSAEFIPLRRPTALGAGAYSHAAKHSDVEAE
jgi:hypothetical protein